jgi:hypothetical protein
MSDLKASTNKTPTTKRHSPLPALGLGLGLAVIAVSGGWYLPEFYDWSGTQQSHLASIVLWIAGATVAVDLAMMVFAFWLHFTNARQSNQPPFRFRIGPALVVFTLVAVGWFVSRQSVLVGSGLVFGGSAVGLMYMALRLSPNLLWAALILCVQFAPFAWVFRGLYNNGETMTILAMLPATPLLFPVGILASLSQIDPRSLEGWFFLSSFTVAQFWCGILLSKIGPKSILVFLMFTATLAFFSSFVLHALMRA